MKTSVLKKIISYEERQVKEYALACVLLFGVELHMMQAFRQDNLALYAELKKERDAKWLQKKNLETRN